MSEPQDTAALPKIVDELLIDIYANSVFNTAVIMIDRPFKKELTGLEFERRTRNLLFVFGEERRDLGEPLQEQIASYFIGRKSMEVCQLDLATKKPVAVMNVPLTVLE